MNELRDEILEAAKALPANARVTFPQNGAVGFGVELTYPDGMLRNAVVARSAYAFSVGSAMAVMREWAHETNAAVAAGRLSPS